MSKISPLKLGLQQIAEATGESLHVIHNAINAGHLRTFLVGRRRFTKPEDVRAWVDFLQAQSDAGSPVSYRSRALEQDRRAARAAGG